MAIGIASEDKLDRDLIRSVESSPGAEGVWDCIQCGACSGACPVSPYMDLSPRKVMAMVREGFEEEVLSSSAIWLCASCYACSVRCPKNIQITNVMYALKRKAMESGLTRKRFPIPVLAREFFKIVRKSGRNFETLLMALVAFKSSPRLLFKSTSLGWRLLRKGRLPLKPESVRDPQNIESLMSWGDKR